MTDTPVSSPLRPLRLWPGVVAVLLQWFGWLTPSTAFPESAAMYVMLGGLFGGVLLLAVWWLFWSRAPWLERGLALAVFPLAVVVTKPLVHVSIQTGNMGMMLAIYSIPVLSTALVAWSWLSGRVNLSRTARAVSMAGVILLACLGFALLRTEGVTSAGADLHWRWTRSYEETFLAKADRAAPAPPLPAVPSPAPEPATAPTLGGPEAAPVQKAAAPSGSTATPSDALPAPATVSAVAEWPGFRGRDRDGVVPAVRIDTDWTHSPPVELWRQPIGPGWSSFAVAGDRFYTQEQHGEEEVVSCHDLSTGRRLWKHVDQARFWESNAGAGPRATPTLADGRVYSLGGTAIVNALDAASGALIWSRNAAVDTGAKTPMWGFAGSPLVTEGLVIVAASGRLAAYEAAVGGEPRWKQDRGASYSSPQLMTVDGVAQVVLLTSTGATAIAPADGRVLWEYAWEGVPIVQPARTAEGDLLLTTGGMSGGQGTRRVAVTRGRAGWKIEERWTSMGLKPYFNDFVVHRGHAYGFDGSILACIDLVDGQRKWKGGRYGQGQLVLLPEQDLLLVLAEEGDLALVKATPDAFTEVARVRAIEGKTWNHPVLVGDRLLVRNGQEMAAFRLARAGD